MSDVEKWIDLEGPEPENVRRLFDALREGLPSRAESEDMERELLEKLALQETGAAPEAALPLSFEAWAELSASLIGAGPAERLEALETHDLAFDDWTRCEERYYASLVDDLAATRTVRVDLYARLCGEAVARRKMLPVGSAVDAPAGAVAAGALPALDVVAVAAPPTEAATFQKFEQGPALAPASPPERKSNPLAMTAPPVQMPSAMLAEQGKLPFKPAPPAPPAPPPAPVPTGQEKTVPLWAVDPFKGGTFPIGTTREMLERGVLPFGDPAMTGTDAAPYPRLAVTEYATFCAMLAEAAPEEVEGILLQFKVVGKASREALDLHWQHILSVNPTMRGLFDQLYPGYLAHVRELKRRQRGA